MVTLVHFVCGQCPTQLVRPSQATKCCAVHQKVFCPRSDLPGKTRKNLPYIPPWTRLASVSTKGEHPAFGVPKESKREVWQRFEPGVFIWRQYLLLLPSKLHSTFQAVCTLVVPARLLTTVWSSTIWTNKALMNSYWQECGNRTSLYLKKHDFTKECFFCAS